MSDLISRQTVLEMLHNLGGCDATDDFDKGWDKAIKAAIRNLDKIPTAYDVDTVVEKLQDLVRHCVYMHDWSGQSKVVECIDVVKGAVKDEIN